MDEIYIHLKFNVETKFGKFTDSLLIPLDEYNNIDKNIIELKKQERVNNFIYLMENPVPEREPSKEDIENELQMLHIMESELVLRKVRCNSKLADIQAKELKNKKG